MLLKNKYNLFSAGISPPHVFLVLSAFLLSGIETAHADFTTQGSLTVSQNSGNVGIGSANPGQVLDVQGTVRSIGFTLTGNGAAAGFILR